MQIVSSTDARNNFSAIIDSAQNEPVLVRKQGRDAVMIISCEDYTKLANRASAEFNKAADDIGKYAASKGMTEELLAELLAEEDHDKK